MNAKQGLYFGKVASDEAARFAQVLLVDRKFVPVRWYIFAPQPYRAHGEGEVPTVICPVVDCTGIPDGDEMTLKMAKIIGRCVDAVHGVLNKSGLLTGLEALGAVCYPAEQPNISLEGCVDVLKPAF